MSSRHGAATICTPIGSVPSAEVPQRTTASDVEDSKPAPDIVKAALEKLGRKAEEVLMLGDTPYDIESAGRSGVRTVALRCGGDTRLDGAVGVYNDPLDLLNHLSDLPLR